MLNSKEINKHHFHQIGISVSKKNSQEKVTCTTEPEHCCPGLNISTWIYDSTFFSAPLAYAKSCVTNMTWHLTH